MPVQRGNIGKLVQTVVGGGGGTQYVVATTGVSTGTGTLFIGVNVDTAVPIKVDAAGVVSVSGGGGGVQYTLATTTIAATGTGTLIFGINSTTLRAIRMTADGTIFVANTGTQVISGNIATVSTLLGTLTISGTVDGTFGGGQQYVQDTTTIGVTGTGTLFIGVNATTARALTLSATGDPGVRQITSPWVCTAANVTIASITTGTVSISGSIATVSTVSTLLGTVVVTAANVTIASITTGTMNVVNTVAVSGSVTPLGQPFAVYQTHVATQWNSGLVTITTSAAGVGGILKTSAADTVYVTDVLVSVDVPMNITLRSATTGLAIVYLATKGGLTMTLRTPMVCTTAQSFTFIPSLSGSASVWAAGYTVT